MKTDQEMIALAERAANLLEGTCDTLFGLGPEIEEAHLTSEVFGRELDQRVFCCETCDWWFPISEMSEINEWSCVECDE